MAVVVAALGPAGKQPKVRASAVPRTKRLQGRDVEILEGPQLRRHLSARRLHSDRHPGTHLRRLMLWALPVGPHAAARTLDMGSVQGQSC